MTDESRETPTPMTDKLKIPSEALLLLHKKGVPEKIVEGMLILGEHARTLERALAAAKAEVERLDQLRKNASAAVVIAQEMTAALQNRAEAAESALREERERCAKVCEDIMQVPHGDGSYTGMFRHFGNAACAHAIRALKEKP